MKTIAQQLNVKDFPFSIKDANGNRIYYENSNGFWFKSEYDADNNEIYYENSNGYWWRRQYDANGNKIYFEDSTGMIIDNSLLTFNL
jgi:glucan-binding YG repeat protein